MKVKVDVFLGEKNFIDLSFFNRRKEWLPGTGLYVEFSVNGKYDEMVSFLIEPENTEAVKISRYSWNKFFINIENSSKVVLKIKVGNKVVVEDSFDINVDDIFPAFTFPKFSSAKLDHPIFFTISKSGTPNIGSTARFLINSRRLVALICMVSGLSF